MKNLNVLDANDQLSSLMGGGGIGTGKIIDVFVPEAVYLNILNDLFAGPVVFHPLPDVGPA